MPRLRQAITFFAVVLLLVASLGCATTGNAETSDVMTGTVEFLNIEGGCWIIRTDDGRTLSPIPMPFSMRQHGLRVSFTASAEPDVMTACMVGEPVKLLSIEPLPAQNAK